MKAKILLTVLAFIIGYGLIIGGFIIFGKSLPEEVMIFDIVLLCLLYTEYMVFAIMPWMNPHTDDNPRAAALGFILPQLAVSTVLAVIIMACGIYWHWAFKYQIIAQVAVLMLVIFAFMAADASARKAKSVYADQQAVLGSREQLRKAFASAVDRAERLDTLDAKDLARLRTLKDEVRYLTPSSSAAARKCEHKMREQLADLKVMIAHPEDNETGVASSIASLERLMRRRKEIC